MTKKKQTVLITGADGFIGSHLAELLFREGYDVKALSLYNSFNSWGWLEDVDCLNSIDIISGDVRDPYLCNGIVKDVDIVFHLAALVAIPYSYIAPESYIETNVKGTLNICQAALDNGVKRVMLASTSEVYGTAQYVPINETHPLQPQSPYSASKIASDSIAMSFFNAFGLPLTVVRPFNTYGPRQSARAVIPTIISQIASGMRNIKLGDLSPTRDFNYVTDTCRGFLELARCDKAVGEVINVGSNTEISIEDTLNVIRELMSCDVDFLADEQRFRPARSEVFRLWCDNRKLRELTGFKPEYDIRTGLKTTIDWFTRTENLAKYKADIYSV